MSPRAHHDRDERVGHMAYAGGDCNCRDCRFAWRAAVAIATILALAIILSCKVTQ